MVETFLFIRRGSRLAAVIAASLALATCGSSATNVPPVTSRSGVVADPKLGTVVIGQIFAGNGSADESCPYRMITDWVRRTPPGETPDMTAPRQHRVTQTACSIANKETPPTFTTFQLMPGTYVLFQITRHTPFSPIAITNVRNTAAAETSTDGLTMPRFSVAAGEVVYVGNVVFLNSFPAEIRGASTPEPARAALRVLWPEGAVRIVDRRMVIGPQNP